MVAVILVLIVLLPSERSSRSDYAERVRQKVEVAEAKRCIAELERHQPAIDVDNDISRGDPTPIGLTSIPHDPPTPTTFYQGACSTDYDGTYRPTGKWFAHGGDSFSFRAKSDEYNKCQQMARNYVARYNYLMTERMPEDVRQFCRSQRLTDEGRKAAAAIAVFFPDGKARFARHGEVQEKIGGVVYLTKPTWLIERESQSFLVLTSRPFATGENCALGEDCVELIGLAQVTPKGQQFALIRRWLEMAQIGRSGWKYEGLSCCREINKLNKNTELLVRESYVGNGCRSWRQTIIELTPTGPLNRGVVYMSLDRPGRNGGASFHLEGEIGNVETGKSFDVIVSGTGVRERYRLQGGRYVGPATSKLKC